MYKFHRMKKVTQTSKEQERKCVFIDFTKNWFIKLFTKILSLRIFSFLFKANEWMNLEIWVEDIHMDIYVKSFFRKLKVLFFFISLLVLSLNWAKRKTKEEEIIKKVQKTNKHFHLALKFQNKEFFFWKRI